MLAVLVTLFLAIHLVCEQVRWTFSIHSAAPQRPLVAPRGPRAVLKTPDVVSPTWAAGSSSSSSPRARAPSPGPSPSRSRSRSPK